MVALFQLVIDIDRSIFNAINSLAHKSGVLDWLARLGADDHIIPLVLTLLVLLILFIAKNHPEREDAFNCLLCVLIAVAISTIIVYALNLSFFRPKPFTSHHVALLFYHNTDSAFPSNAATLAFSMSFALLFYNRKVASVMLLLSAYLGLARITVGVHYPLDILAGAVLALAAALLAKALEPVYRPLSVRMNLLVDRLLGSWRAPAATDPRGAGPDD